MSKNSETPDSSKLSDLALAELPDNYTAMSAKEKQNFIWKRTEDSRFETLPEQKVINPLSAIAADPGVSINRTYDTMPSEQLNKFQVRNRVIHTQGAMVKVRFVPSPGQVGGYTGTLGTGANYGLLRFSTVSKVGGAITGMTPGFGLKFFVDGKTSPSLVAMYTLEGQGLDYNFFSNDFFTVIPPASSAGTKAIDARFLSATDARTKDKIKIARIVSVEPFSEITEKGDYIGLRKTPRYLKFVANPVLKSTWGPNTEQDVRVKLTEGGYISAGTHLYTVYACDTFDKDKVDIKDRDNCKFTKLGDLISDSEVIASRFGDVAVFFNHRAYNEAEFDKYVSPDTSIPQPQ